MKEAAPYRGRSHLCQSNCLVLLELVIQSGQQTGCPVLTLQWEPRLLGAPGLHGALGRGGPFFLLWLEGCSGFTGWLWRIRVSLKEMDSTEKWVERHLIKGVGWLLFLEIPVKYFIEFSYLVIAKPSQCLGTVLTILFFSTGSREEMTGGGF